MLICVNYYANYAAVNHIRVRADNISNSVTVVLIHLLSSYYCAELCCRWAYL